MQAQLALVESALTSVYSPGAPSHERKSAEQTLQAFCDSPQSWDISLTALSRDRYQLWHLFFAQHLQRCCVGVAKGKLPWGAPDHGVKVQHAQQLLALLQASITPQRAAPVVKTLARATAHAALSVPAMLLAVVQHACARLACETTCIVLHEVGQAVAELRSWAGVSDAELEAHAQLQDTIHSVAPHVLSWANHAHAACSGGSMGDAARTALVSCMAAWVALGALHGLDASQGECTAAAILSNLLIAQDVAPVAEAAWSLVEYCPEYLLPRLHIHMGPLTARALSEASAGRGHSAYCLCQVVAAYAQARMAAMQLPLGDSDHVPAAGIEEVNLEGNGHHDSGCVHAAGGRASATTALQFELQSRMQEMELGEGAAVIASLENKLASCMQGTDDNMPSTGHASAGETHGSGHVNPGYDPHGLCDPYKHVEDALVMDGKACVTEQQQGASLRRMLLALACLRSVTEELGRPVSWPALEAWAALSEAVLPVLCGRDTDDGGADALADTDADVDGGAGGIRAWGRAMGGHGMHEQDEHMECMGMDAEDASRAAMHTSRNARRSLSLRRPDGHNQTGTPAHLRRVLACLPGYDITSHPAEAGPMPSVSAALRQDYQRLCTGLLSCIAAWGHAHANNCQQAGKSSANHGALNTQCQGQSTLAASAHSTPAICALPWDFLGVLHELLAGTCGVLGIDAFLSAAARMLELAETGPSSSTGPANLISCAVALATLAAAKLGPGGAAAATGATISNTFLLMQQQLQSGQRQQQQQLACSNCHGMLQMYSCLAAAACCGPLLAECSMDAEGRACRVQSLLDMASQGLATAVCAPAAACLLRSMATTAQSQGLSLPPTAASLALTALHGLPEDAPAAMQSDLALAALHSLSCVEQQEALQLRQQLIMHFLHSTSTFACNVVSWLDAHPASSPEPSLQSTPSTSTTRPQSRSAPASALSGVVPVLHQLGIQLSHTASLLSQAAGVGGASLGLLEDLASAFWKHLWPPLQHTLRHPAACAGPHIPPLCMLTGSLFKAGLSGLLPSHLPTQQVQALLFSIAACLGLASGCALHEPLCSGLRLLATRVDQQEGRIALLAASQAVLLAPQMAALHALKAADAQPELATCVMKVCAVYLQVCAPALQSESSQHASSQQMGTLQSAQGSQQASDPQQASRVSCSAGILASRTGFALQPDQLVSVALSLASAACGAEHKQVASAALACLVSAASTPAQQRMVLMHGQTVLYGASGALLCSSPLPRLHKLSTLLGYLSSTALAIQQANMQTPLSSSTVQQRLRVLLASMQPVLNGHMDTGALVTAMTEAYIKEQDSGGDELELRVARVVKRHLRTWLTKQRH